MTTFRDAWWTFIGDLAVVSIVAIPVAGIVWVVVSWFYDDADPVFPAVMAGAIIYVLALFVGMSTLEGW